MNGEILAEKCLARPMAAPSYDLDIEPDDVCVSYTVTEVWGNRIIRKILKQKEAHQLYVLVSFLCFWR